MRRSHSGRRNVLAIAAAVALCGCGARVSLATNHGRCACGSCTNDAAAGYGGMDHGRVAGTMRGVGHARVACMPARRGHGAMTCGPRGCGQCGHGHCGRRPCCPDVCCPGPCDECGHCIHHDVYEKRYFLRSQGKSWHSAWYDPAEGRPIALVVPPTAEFQAQYGWGVPSSRVAPIYHQFRRPYPGPGAVGGSGGGFLPTPNQPSDTVQFGVNAVRGPWAY